MDLLELNYITSCKRYSDIHEHLPILYKYACQVKHITELGVGPGNSTAAFMYARPKKFITYDILSNGRVQEFIKLAKSEGLDYTYHVASTLEVDIEPTDFLFIDSKHTYEQLKEELKLHADKVSTYLGFHDIQKYGYNDEDNIYDKYSDTFKVG